jgi:hypothetical protein
VLAKRIELAEPFILSESALIDWLRPEEDEAWKHLGDLPELRIDEKEPQDDLSN